MPIFVDLDSGSTDFCERRDVKSHLAKALRKKLPGDALIAITPKEQITSGGGVGKPYLIVITEDVPASDLGRRFHRTQVYSLHYVAQDVFEDQTIEDAEKDILEAMAENNLGNQVDLLVVEYLANNPIPEPAVDKVPGSTDLPLKASSAPNLSAELSTPSSQSARSQFVKSRSEGSIPASSFEVSRQLHKLDNRLLVVEDDLGVVKDDLRDARRQISDQGRLIEDRTSDLRDAQRQIADLGRQIADLQRDKKQLLLHAVHRQIAINVETAMKLDLLNSCGIRNPLAKGARGGEWTWMEAHEQKWLALNELCSNANTQKYLLVQADWFSRSDSSEFHAAMGALKSRFSKDVAHPTLWEGQQVTLNTAIKLLDEGSFQDDININLVKRCLKMMDDRSMGKWTLR